MFFLKKLPTRDMVESYTKTISKDEKDPDIILSRLNGLREASLLIRKLDDFFAGHGLSQLRYLIMIVIDREPERSSLSHKEIGERIDVSKPVITRTLNSMIEDGYLQSKRDKNDGRARYYSLSDQGKLKLHDLLPAYFALIKE
ncbi:MAG: MarR family transcriptional regulator [Sneathiellales bacterium]|nr:MarR family transcriptional regulator [Sneathiellales bacterium]